MVEGGGWGGGTVEEPAAEGGGSGQWEVCVFAWAWGAAPFPTSRHLTPPPHRPVSILPLISEGEGGWVVGCSSVRCGGVSGVYQPPLPPTISWGV